MDGDLFSTDIKYLNITHNNEKSDKKWEDFFFSEDYEEFNCVTYVSSPKFFFEFTKRFKRIELIIGIDASEIPIQFMPEYLISFLNEPEIEIRKKIKNEDIKIMYANLGSVIHSKIYLLKDKNGNISRVIIGSANFTERALKGKNQFEELLVYDRSYNSVICDLYAERYKEIFKNTTNILPKELKETYKKELFIKNEDYLSFMLKESIEKAETIGNNETINDVIYNQKQVEERVTYKLKEEIETNNNIIRAITKKTNDGTKFIRSKDIDKKVKELSIRIFKDKNQTSSNSANKNDEKQLFYNNDEHTIFIKNNLTTEQFPSRLNDKSKLSFYLNQIDRFINIYSSYTAGKDEKEKIKDKKRIFEVILYSFMSPYIWKIREETKKTNELLIHDIPVFLIIAGQSRTGKSRLLSFINKLLGAYKEVEIYDPREIRDRLYTEYVYPILIDEIKREYFYKSGSGSKGNEFIKMVTNSLGKDGAKYPVLIGATNTDFSGEEALTRRIYYILVNKQFEESKRRDAESVYNNIIKELNDELFKDFLHRMTDKIENDDILNFDSSPIDFLWAGREIFKEYFKETNQPLPDWYNDKRIDDYYEQGKDRWRRLYRSKKEQFVIQGDTIILEADIFKGKKGISEYIDYLPSGIIKDKTTLDMVLYKDKFFKFIESGIENNYTGVIKRFTNWMYKR
jgi:hypothetical protein